MLPAPAPLKLTLGLLKLALLKVVFHQSGSFTASVEATNPPTSTCAPRPNKTPLGLISHTCPLASRDPKICEPLLDVIRLIAMALADGCRKSTVSPAPMLKLCQEIETS